jgi:hypothetical protein
VQQQNERTDVAGASGSGVHAHSAVQTDVTLSNEDNGGEAEVQSTPEGFAPKTPYVGMVFDSFDAALTHYNIFAKHVYFL